jgi:hypothetical protein
VLPHPACAFLESNTAIALSRAAYRTFTCSLCGSLARLDAESCGSFARLDAEVFARLDAAPPFQPLHSNGFKNRNARARVLTLIYITFGASRSYPPAFGLRPAFGGLKRTPLRVDCSMVTLDAIGSLVVLRPCPSLQWKKVNEKRGARGAEWLCTRSGTHQMPEAPVLGFAPYGRLRAATRLLGTLL